MKTIELIETYLEGNLKGLELEEFQDLLIKDVTFKEEVKIHNEVNKSIADDDLQNFRLLVKNLVRNRNSSKIRHLKIFSTAAAAAAIVIISLVSITKQPVTNKAFSEFYTPYQTDLNTRSADFIHNEFEFGYLLYQKGEYLKAFEMFEKHNNSVQNNSTANFYYGLCAMELGKYEITENSLRSVIKENNSPFTLHAKWYLSLLYLKTNRNEEALPILNDLASRENFYSKKADIMIKEFY